MKLQKFEGGVATRLAPQLLNLNQGVVFENIDTATGILAPIKDKLKTDIEVKQYPKFYISGDEWLSSDTLIDYLEFQGKMYLTDRENRPQKYYDGSYSFLGIKAGTISNPTITSGVLGIKAGPVGVKVAST